jgi:hypothetical protein
VLNAIEEFEQVENQRVSYIYTLSKIVQESRHMRNLVEEENSRLKDRAEGIEEVRVVFLS